MTYSNLLVVLISEKKTSYETPELHILVCKISVPKYYVEEFKFHSFIETGLFGVMV